jgi:hypothetical protein
VPIQKLKIAPPAVSQAKAAERLARVTGDEPKTTTRKPVPPGFSEPPDGIYVAPGQTQQIQASRFTESERKGLTAAGWTEKSDVSPEEARDVIELLEAQGSLPGQAFDPRQGKTPYEIKDYSQGTDEQKAKFDQAVLDIRKRNQEAEEKRARQKDLHPSIKAGIEAATKITGEDDLEAKAQDLLNPTPKMPEKAAAKEEKVESESGAAAASPASSICENCGHDSAQEAIKELPMVDREAFLSSFLAGQPYVKTCPIYAGKMIIKFRSLPMLELDACFLASQQFVVREHQRTGNLLNQYEITQRYRLCLQLQEISVPSNPDSAMNVRAADGLCKELNPRAADFWVTEEMPIDQEAKGNWLCDNLERIYESLRNNVFVQESSMRVIVKQLRNFNREVFWLESHSDDEGFLQPTEEQP